MTSFQDTQKGLFLNDAVFLGGLGQAEKRRLIHEVMMYSLISGGGVGPKRKMTSFMKSLKDELWSE